MTELEFITDHWYLEDLPGDPDDENVRRQVNGAAWSRVAPTPTADPALIAHSAEIATELGISATVVASQQFTRAFSGNEVPADMMPFAMTYGGHQFGNWAG